MHHVISMQTEYTELTCSHIAKKTIDNHIHGQNEIKCYSILILNTQYSTVSDQRCDVKSCCFFFNNIKMHIFSLPQCNNTL